MSLFLLQTIAYLLLDFRLISVRVSSRFRDHTHSKCTASVCTLSCFWGRPPLETPGIVFFLNLIISTGEGWTEQWAS